MPEILYDDAQTVGDSLRAIVRQLLAMPANSVRPADQVAPVGGTAEPFASVRYVSEDYTGDDVESWADVAPDTATPPNDLSNSMIGPREALFSINFYRSGSLKRARRLQALLASPAGLELLDAADLGVSNVSSVRNLSAIESAEFEERAQVDLTVRFTAIEAAVGPSFNRFPVSIDNGATVSSTEVIKQ
jgi:hypothetical protein